MIENKYTESPSINLENLLKWEDGTNLKIEFRNSLIVEYEKVKKPIIFIINLLNSYYEINWNNNELDIIKKYISSISIKKIGIHQSYFEIWNKESYITSPFKLLLRFDIDTYKKYMKFFIENIEFTRQYLSIHFPFDHFFINDYWDYLVLGDAHYTVYINDEETIYYSHFGLSYNKNFRWPIKFKLKYKLGLWNPFIGEYVGIDYPRNNENYADFLDVMIPLDFKEEISRRNEELSYWNMKHLDFLEEKTSYFIEIYDEKDLFEKIGYLEFEDFLNIYNNKPLKALINESIWKNTLQYIIDKDFCYAFFEWFKSFSQHSKLLRESLQKHHL